MSDTALPVYIHYGTNAQRTAFTPSPPSTGQPIYVWYESDTDTTWIYTTSWHQVSGSGGGVTASGTLTANNVILGNGTSVVKALGSLGTTTTLLHGNAGGAPTFAAVVEADITLADNTTNDVSTSKHGLFPKLQSGSISYLLAVASYNPGTIASQATSSSTFADVDATNLTITFTAPASGNVIVVLTACANQSTSGSAYYWNLRTTGGSNITNSAREVQANTGITTVSHRVYLTGLSAGSTTYRWGHAAGSNTGTIFYGDDGTTHRGPALMEVWAV